MHLFVEYLVLCACLLGVVAAVQAVAARLNVAEATALSILGVGIGASYYALDAFAPELTKFLLDPLLAS